MSVPAVILDAARRVAFEPDVCDGQKTKHAVWSLLRRCSRQESDVEELLQLVSFTGDKEVFYTAAMLFLFHHEGSEVPVGEKMETLCWLCLHPRIRSVISIVQILTESIRVLSTEELEAIVAYLASTSASRAHITVSQATSPP